MTSMAAKYGYNMYSSYLIGYFEPTCIQINITKQIVLSLV